MHDLTVVIITFNHQDYISKLLDTLIEIQLQIDIEILIVDDGSNDGTSETISIYADRYSFISATINEHRGISAITNNINSQLKLSKSIYSMVIAGDDFIFGNELIEFYRESVSKAADIAIADGEDFDLIQCKVIGHTQDSRLLELIRQDKFEELLNILRTNVPKLLTQSYLTKTELLKEISYYDEELIADDWCLNLRLFSRALSVPTKVVVSDRIVFRHNIHNNNTSRNNTHMYVRIRQVFSKYLSGPLRIKRIIILDVKNIMKSIMHRDFQLFKLVIKMLLSGIFK